MDRRIGMVRPPGQHDAELAGAFQFGEHPFAFGPELGAVGFLFEGGDAYGCAELLFGMPNRSCSAATSVSGCSSDTNGVYRVQSCSSSSSVFRRMTSGYPATTGQL